MVAFFKATAGDPGRWDAVSEAAVTRVREKYNWEWHARKLLSLSRIYGFWKYITTLEREETRRYLDMFYGLMLRWHSRKMLLS